MTREYSLTTMFYQMPAASLEGFFQRANVLGDFNFGTYTRGRADALRRALRRCPPDIQSRLGGHIRDIFTLCDSDGAALILEQLVLSSPGRRAEAEGIEHVYARAMWLYLEFGGIPDGLYENCLMIAEAQSRRFAPARRVQDLPDREPSTSPQVLKELEGMISPIYQQQGRGVGCRVRYYQRSNPERHYFLAAQEDFGRTALHFQGDDLNRIDLRPSVMVTYIFQPEKGTLDLSAPATTEQGKALQHAFCRVVLDLPGAPPKLKAQSLLLNSVLSPDFVFDSDVRDDIDSVSVVAVGLTTAHDGVRRLAIDCPSRTSLPVRTWLPATLVQLYPPLDLWNVSELKFQVRFRDGSGSGGGHLTFTLTNTGSCSLKDKPRHRLMKRYLRRWMLVA